MHEKDGALGAEAQAIQPFILAPTSWPECSRSGTCHPARTTLVLDIRAKQLLEAHCAISMSYQLLFRPWLCMPMPMQEDDSANSSALLHQHPPRVHHKYQSARQPWIWSRHPKQNTTFGLCTLVCDIAMHRQSSQHGNIMDILLFLAFFLTELPQKRPKAWSDRGQEQVIWPYFRKRS